MSAEEDALLAEVVSAHRDVISGEVRPHRAWADLDDAGRSRAHEIALAVRAVEAALDAEGLSTTAHAVLARIRGGG